MLRSKTQVFLLFSLVRLFRRARSRARARSRHNPGRVSRFQGARPSASSHRTRAASTPTRPRSSPPFVLSVPPPPPRAAMRHLRAKNKSRVVESVDRAGVSRRAARPTRDGPRCARGPDAEVSPSPSARDRRRRPLTRLPPSLHFIRRAPSVERRSPRNSRASTHASRTLAREP
jgi:hypothetical protein